jgi:Amt family ammonium transporter
MRRAANEGDYSVASDWFFQMVFCATTASIVSGTLAERIKLWPFLIFTAILTGVLYPITGSWQWGAGWLSEAWASPTSPARRWCTRSAAGRLLPVPSSWVHARASTAQTARSTRSRVRTWRLQRSAPSSCGSAGSASTAHRSWPWARNGDVSDISRIFANTNLAAAGGVVAAMILTQIMYKKVDVTMALNGALAGLVSITAEPLMPSAAVLAIIIGAVGGVIVVFAVPLLDKLKIDDVVGAIPVHLLAGIWGTLVVPLSNSDASFGTQIIGIAAYGAFTLVATAILWMILKVTIGIRVSPEEEMMGLDKAEVGVEAYPEFARGGSSI